MEQDTTFLANTKEKRRIKMNFRKRLTRGLKIVIPVAFMVALTIALVAGPAGAITQAPATPVQGMPLNDPVPPPMVINYQGYLTDSSGNPINDTLEMTFLIYDTAEGGTPLWQETHPSVTVTDGLFNVLLGSIDPNYVSYLSGETYLGIKIGSDTEMTPRQRMTHVAYAWRAEKAQNAYALDGMDSTDFVAVAGDTMTGRLVLPANGLVAGNDQFVLADGKVSIGTTDAQVYKLYVKAGKDYGIGAISSNVGVYGEHTGTGNYGQLGTSDKGVEGHSDSNMGVYGSSNDIGENSFGVYGINLATGSFGQLGNPGYGVLGQHGLTENAGLLGMSTAGVYGNSISYYGVKGYSKYTNGVYGESYSSAGVQGTNISSSNYGQLGTSDDGVYGYNSDSGNYGQLGTSDDGVYGYNSGSSSGVRGYNSDYRNFGELGTTDYGVYGVNQKDGGSAVYGHDLSNFTMSKGVYGSSLSGRGVYGSGKTGVYGYSNNSTGVRGEGVIWDIYAVNGKYGPFTGAHEVKLADSFAADVQPGLIVSINGESKLRTEEGEISYSSTLPTVQLADTPNDKAVFGVLIKEAPLPEDHWYQAAEGERFGIVNALGDGRVWVTNINGDIEAGDYITTSAIAGYGQKQDDDLLHSYTLGKATETIDWSQVTDTIEFNGQVYKIYTIAVVYTSG
jgi:hypothetical protein